jgi:hypothetical protein
VAPGSSHHSKGGDRRKLYGRGDFRYSLLPSCNELGGTNLNRTWRQTTKTGEIKGLSATFGGLTGVQARPPAPVDVLRTATEPATAAQIATAILANGWTMAGQQRRLTFLKRLFIL